MQAFVQSHPFLWPFLFGAAIYGVRYIVMAVAMYWVATPVPGRGWGRPHLRTPQTFDSKMSIRRELAYSVFSVIAFGLVNAALFGFGWVSSSMMYIQLSLFPMWWFWLSIVIMLLLHDTYFYWLHRVMHTRPLYKLMHKVHHQSIYPTAFAAYSFHPAEPFAEAAIVVAIMFIIPTHPLAFLIFESISTAYNVYGHCGREFYPKGMASHWLGRWMNTSTVHAAHHFDARDNYGLCFLLWDRLMKTVGASYK